MQFEKMTSRISRRRWVPGAAGPASGRKGGVFQQPANLFLVGFMASGKTSVGRALAARLGRRFVDTDGEVERASGRRVAAIFGEAGEAGFRKLEAAAVKRAARGRERVIAVGGGAPSRPGNVAVMRGSGVIVYLQAAFERLFERMERDGFRQRPLWKGRTRRRRFLAMRSLFEERRPLYVAVADVTVRGHPGSPEDVAERVHRRVASR